MKALVSTERIRFALQLADVAADIVRARYRTPFTSESKADATPVTEVDREVEAACRERVATAWPDEGVIGEEFGADQPGAAWQWIIDPIDGTRAFMAGRPTFGTLIAVAYEGRSVLGVIDQPIVRDRWLGVAGQSTLFNDEPVVTRRCGRLHDAVVGTTTPELFQADELPSWQELQRLLIVKIRQPLEHTQLPTDIDDTVQRPARQNNLPARRMRGPGNSSHPTQIGRKKRHGHPLGR